MKTKFYEFDPVIYPFPLLVCKYVSGHTPDDIASTFNGVVDEHTVQAIDDGFRPNPTSIAKTACVVSKKSGEMYYLVILYRPRRCSFGVVTHESLHVMTMLFDWLGIKPPTLSEDEPHAYFSQWVANCIGSILEGHPEMMKGIVFNDNEE